MSDPKPTLNYASVHGNVCLCIKALSNTAHHYFPSLLFPPVCPATREGVHALARVSLSMSRLCLRSIRPVRWPAGGILIMPADVGGVAQRLSAG